MQGRASRFRGTSGVQGDGVHDRLERGPEVAAPGEVGGQLGRLAQTAPVSTPNLKLTDFVLAPGQVGPAKAGMTKQQALATGAAAGASS